MPELPQAPPQLQQLVSLLTQGRGLTATALQGTAVTVVAVSAQQLQLQQGSQRFSLPIKDINPPPRPGDQFQLRFSEQRPSQLLLVPPQSARQIDTPALQGSLFQVLDNALFKGQGEVISAKVIQSSESQLTLSIAGQRLTVPLKQPLADVKIGQQVQLQLINNQVRLLTPQGIEAQQWRSEDKLAKTPASQSIQALLSLLSKGAKLVLQEPVTRQLQPLMSDKTVKPELNKGLQLTAESRQLVLKPLATASAAEVRVTLARGPLITNKASGQGSGPSTGHQLQKTQTEPPPYPKQPQTNTEKTKDASATGGGTSKTALTGRSVESNRVPSPPAASETKTDKAGQERASTASKPFTPLTDVFRALTQGVTAPSTDKSATEKVSPARLWLQLPDTVKQQLTAPVIQLQRAHLSQSERPGSLVQQLYAALDDLAKGDKQHLQPLVSTLKSAVPASQPIELEHIRGLLTSPPLPLTAPNLSQIQPNSSFVGALVNLLQVVLASRLSRTQPAAQTRVVEALATLLSPVSASAAGNRGRRATPDLSQWEQKHQVGRLIGKLLSSHSQAKLNNIEQLQQQNEQLYYALPLPQGNQQQAEILIKRRWPDAEKKRKRAKGQQQWQLTMTLPVGNDERLMAKAHFEQQALKLDFYAMSDTVRDKVLNFLPWLQKRLKEAGVEISSSSCQLGKVPESLATKPYQILQTQV